ncbi:MAG TPA: TolC family protein [Terriglobales bacterium]|nr:TolC family protein [Terriglobales bacterium]
MKGLAVLVLSLLAVWPAMGQQEPPALLDAMLAQHHVETSAPTYTLDDLEAAALTGNPGLKAAAARIAVVEARAPQAGALEDPMLQVRTWGVPLRRPWDLDRSQNMVMLSQALPGPGKRGLADKVARQDVAISRSELEAMRRDVLLQVRQAYYDLLRNRDELLLHDRQVALARQAFEAARIKYSVGKVPQQDTLKAQIVLTRLVEHLVMLDEQGAMARARLNTLLGRGPGEPLRVVGAYTSPDQLPALSELERAAIANRPELAGLRRSVQQGEDKLALARKTYLPDFQVGAGYMLGPTGMEFRNGYMAEFSMTLPWFNKRRHDSEIAEASAEISLRNAELESKRNAVRQELQEALIRVQSAKRLVDLYRNTLAPQVDSALRSASAAYQTDRTDFLNLIDSQNMALDVRTAYYRSLADLDTRLSELERATGTPIRRAISPRQGEAP